MTRTIDQSMMRTIDDQSDCCCNQRLLMQMLNADAVAADGSIAADIVVAINPELL